MSDNYLNPKDPPNSPLEKLALPRRHVRGQDITQYFLRQGMDSKLAEQIGRGLAEWDIDKYYNEHQHLLDLEYWANIHTHGGLATIPELEWGVGELHFVNSSNHKIWDLDTSAEHADSQGHTGASITRPPNNGILRYERFKVLYSGTGFTSAASSNARSYDRLTNAWTALASMPANRRQAATGLLLDRGDAGVYYTWAGNDGSFPVSTHYAYDIALDTWTTLASYPHAVTLVGGVGHSDGLLYSFGASSGSGSTKAYYYDPDQDGAGWQVITDPPLGGQMLATSYKGSIYIMAGGNLWIYDPVSNTYDTSPANAPSGTYLSVYGGNDGLKDYLWANTGATVQRYDISADSWTNLGSLGVTDTVSFGMESPPE